MSLVVLAAGCGTTTVSKTVGVPGLPATSPETVQIFELGAKKKPTQPYEIIGKATVVRTKRAVPKGSGNKQLQIVAAQLGADAVVETKLGVVMGPPITFYWAGLAVRWNPSPPATATPKPFVVAVLPIPQDTAAPGNQAAMAKAVCQAVAPPLELKGYYAKTNGPVEFQGGIEAALELPDDQLRALGGEDSHYLLDLNYLAQANVNIVIGASSAVGIRARLLEKSTRKILYQGEATGSGYTGWLINLAMPNAKRIMAASAGAAAALRNIKGVDEQVPSE